MPCWRARRCLTDLMSASGLLSDASAKVLKSTEDAHIKIMSIFESEEHFRASDAVALLYSFEGPIKLQQDDADGLEREGSALKARDAHILWTPADCKRRLLRRGDHPPGSVKVLPFLSDGDRKEAARYKRDAGASFHRILEAQPSEDAQGPGAGRVPRPCSEGRHASAGSAPGLLGD